VVVVLVLLPLLLLLLLLRLSHLLLLQLLLLLLLALLVVVMVWRRSRAHHGSYYAWRVHKSWGGGAFYFWIERPLGENKLLVGGTAWRKRMALYRSWEHMFSRKPTRLRYFEPQKTT
jgi:hypothetical protein